MPLFYLGLTLQGAKCKKIVNSLAFLPGTRYHIVSTHINRVLDLFSKQLYLI